MSARMSTTANPLGSLNSLKAREGQTGSGYYLLTGAEERISRSNAAYLHVVLEDATGRTTGTAWSEHRQSIELPALPAVVAVTGRVKILNDTPHLNVVHLAPASIDAVPYATDLLPRQRCPEKALSGLDALTALEQSLPAPLDGFLKRVLLDPTIGLPFLRCRASVSHHHAFEGGLLAHSTEMLGNAANLAGKMLPRDPTAPAMAQLGLLLHDLGKLRTVGETRRPHGTFVIPHEFVSIEMLAPHLRWLEQQDFDLALGVRYVVCYLATPKKARQFAKYAVAEVIEYLDELSAASHHGRDLEHLVSGREWKQSGRIGTSTAWPRAASNAERNR